MTRTREAITNFLSNRIGDSPFLLSRYSTDLETQVMVDNNGEPGDKPGTYTDGSTTWSNKRWPYQAGTNPNFSDPELGFSPSAHVERVGTTWWDFVNCCSVAVGIDIDATDGHAETTTTNTKRDIDKILERLQALDYVTVVRSTGGKGLHVYVFFKPDAQPAAKNHHEHTIVARKTLELISEDIGYALKDHVDCVGSVFWIWAKSSPEGHPGFSVVKEGGYLDATRLATISLPTPSIRGHLDTDYESVPLDADHKRILEAISRQPYYFNVRPDMNLVHTHTCAIRDAIANGLQVLGTFETNSSGSDPQTANCFLSPQRSGVFRVFRFGQSQQEPSWKFIDGKNFCTLNDAPSIEELIRESSDGCRAGRYTLTSEGAASLAASLGESLVLPVGSKISAVSSGDGVEIVVERTKPKVPKAPTAPKMPKPPTNPGENARPSQLDRYESDVAEHDERMQRYTEKLEQYQLDKPDYDDQVVSYREEFAGYQETIRVLSDWSKSGDTYTKVIQPVTQLGTLDDRLLSQADEFLRFVTQEGNARGWFHRLEDGTWLEHRSFSDVAVIVSNEFGEFADQVRESMMSSPWKLVRIPFAPQFPGDRQWNRDAPSLAVSPAESGGDHKHFDMILDHIGSDLNIAVSNSEWCRRAGVSTGADYLRCWIACLIHHTDQPLPYLFLAGPQNSGKSVFHECMTFLFSGGIASANSAMSSDHNGELDGCFLAYVEERDLNDKHAKAYAKIKEWVTGRTIQIHPKYVQPYSVKNYLHFVQMSNSTHHLPLEDGDTRIIAIDVPSLEDPMPKALLEAGLREEAPRFLRTLLNTIIPPPVDRLRIPALETETKRLMERRAMSPLMGFAKECVIPSAGNKVLLADFYEAYKQYCMKHGQKADAVFNVQSEIILRSDRLQTGTKAKKAYIVNVTLNPNVKAKAAPIKVSKDGLF